jgi:hypothetical protein
MTFGDVLSDVFGLSGQLMLEALVNGSGGDGQPSAFDIAQQTVRSTEPSL